MPIYKTFILNAWFPLVDGDAWFRHPQFWFRDANLGSLFYWNAHLQEFYLNVCLPSCLTGNVWFRLPLFFIFFLLVKHSWLNISHDCPPFLSFLYSNIASLDLCTWLVFLNIQVFRHLYHQSQFSGSSLQFLPLLSVCCQGQFFFYTD